MRFVSLIAATLSISVLLTTATHASVLQDVAVSFRASSGDILGYAFDNIRDTGGTIPRSVLAQISGTYGNTIASIGPQGDLGVQGSQYQTGTFLNRVSIANSHIPNLLPASRSAAARFVIDGGSLALVAGPGSYLTFTLNLESDVKASNGDVIDTRTWGAIIHMEMPANGDSTPGVTTLGNDIGATTGRLPFIVDIPPTLQTFDLGIIPASGYIDMLYTLTIEAQTYGFNEYVAWEFSDPLSVDGPSQFPTVTFQAQTAQVPAPASLPLMAMGLAGLGLCRRRWRAP